MTITTPPSKRRALTIVLIAAAALFFIAAGVFTALWLSERDDHAGTGGQLSTMRTELDSDKSKLRQAQAKQQNLDAKLQDSYTEAHKLETAKQDDGTCVEEARKLIKAGAEANEAAFGDAWSGLEYYCQ